ncbi:MAG: hypothetical protein IH851_08955, partial [Armatimonadetes bacterium]|nr:hypothetical protein [Armatimonadota bacterium]
MKTARSSIFIAGLLFCLSAAAAGDTPNDEGYTAKILEYTTEPFFLTELVDHLPASDTVPTPESVLGYIVGTPNVLTHTAKINEYMRALGEASPRVLVESMGKSEEGREMLLVVISDAENIRNLGRYKEINARLGDPRTINSDAEAKRLISEALPMYYATGGMHSPESGSPEMLMELAYRLAVEETPFIQEIRKNSIVLLTPVLETDGRDRYVDTYMWRKKNPDKPPIPLIYWGHYVAHDNNRDGMAITLALSKNLMAKWFEYHPQVLHDLHESGTYLYISTGTGPYNAWLDPMVIDEWHIMAYNEINEMTLRGVPGVWTHQFYDGWAPNYAFYAANGHNAIGRFYETFGGYGADTGIRSGGGATSREWYRPNPAFPRVWWSFRNNINMQQSALLLGLNFIARDKERFMRNYYLKSKRSVEKAHNEGPAAYVFPSDDSRKGQQAELLNLLKRQRVEVHTLAEPVETEDGEFAAGSFVVRMDQPYSRMADMLLDTQYYSPDDPRPYDDTGWTLGPLFNVTTVRCKDIAILDARMNLVNGNVSAPGGLRGPPDGKAVIVRHNGDLQVAQLRYKIPDARIEAAKETFTYGSAEYPAGTLILSVDTGNGGLAAIRSALEDVGLFGDVAPEAPDVKTRSLSAARIAILHTWQRTQNEGWFRLAFDYLEIPYHYISVHEIRDNPNLRDEYDVIILAPTRGSAQSIVNGVSKFGEPIPWKPLEGFPHLGGPDTTDNIRGGIELIGMLHLQKFLESGGMLICVGATCAVPIEYGIVSGVSIVEPDELQALGGVFRAVAAAEDSVLLDGYDSEFGVYFSRGPLLSLGGGFGRFRGFGGFGGRQGRGTGRGSLSDPDIVQGRKQYRPGERPDPEKFTTPAAPRQPTGPSAPVILRFP